MKTLITTILILFSMGLFSQTYYGLTDKQKERRARENGEAGFITTINNQQVYVSLYGSPSSSSGREFWTDPKNTNETIIGVWKGDSVKENIFIGHPAPYDNSKDSVKLYIPNSNKISPLIPCPDNEWLTTHEKDESEMPIMAFDTEAQEYKYYNVKIIGSGKGKTTIDFHTVQPKPTFEDKLLDILQEYSEHCYNDSLQRINHKAQLSSDGVTWFTAIEQKGNRYEDYGYNRKDYKYSRIIRDTVCTHKDPNDLKYFINWLKERNQ